MKRLKTFIQQNQKLISGIGTIKLSNLAKQFTNMQPLPNSFFMTEEEIKLKSEKRKSGFFGRLRGNFLTGLAVVLPLALTIWAIWAFVGFVDNRVLPLVPDAYNPLSYIDFNVRGFGVVIFLIFTTFIGAMTKGIFGRSLLKLGESFVDRVPIVRSIYNAVKQIVETVTNSAENNFENACLIEYPRKGIWAIGFISTDTKGEVRVHAKQAEMYSVFLPTTPNPTSGFLLFVPKKDVVVLDMDVETAAKMIISAGIVEPPTPAELKAGKAKRKAPSK